MALDKGIVGQKSIEKGRTGGRREVGTNAGIKWSRQW